jgi:hypothetical protein
MLLDEIDIGQNSWDGYRPPAINLGMNAAGGIRTFAGETREWIQLP